MTFDWDDVLVTDNPKLKEIVVSFPADGGFGRFGSGTTGEPDYPGAPTTPPAPDGSEGVVPPDEALPEDLPPANPDNFPECLPHSCDAIDVYYSGGNEARIAWGIDPEFEIGSASGAGAVNLEPVAPAYELGYIKSKLGGNSGVYNHADAVLAPEVSGSATLCDTNVTSWRLSGGRLPDATVYQNIRDAGVPVANTPTRDAQVDDSDIGNANFGFSQTLFYYFDFRKDGAVLANLPNITPATLRLVRSSRRTDDVGIPGEIGLVAATPAPSINLAGSATGVTVTPSATGGNVSESVGAEISATKDEATGWWKITMTHSVSTRRFQPDPETDPSYFLSETTFSIRLAVELPNGKGTFALVTALDNNARRVLGFDTVRQVAGAPSPYIRWVGGSDRASDALTAPMCFAVSGTAGGEIQVFERIFTDYLTPEYCEILP